MAVSLKHAFQSAKSDGADTTIVRPSNWNEEHVLTMASGFLLGRTSASTGAVEELSASVTRTFLALSSSDSVTFAAVATTSTAAATFPATFKNTHDSNSVAALRLEGDRATPANGDQTYASFYLSDSAGNQDEFARITGEATTATSTSEAGTIRFSVMVAGTLTSTLALRGSALFPATNDTVALGLATNGYADLFLADGGVVNWGNGTYTITQSGANLALSGGITLGTDLAVADGGTGASTAAAARANLEVLKCLTTTQALDFGSISAGAISTLPIALTGAAAGDAVAVGYTAAFNAGLIVWGYCVAADTVTVAVYNTTGSAIDPTSKTVRVTVIKST